MILFIVVLTLLAVVTNWVDRWDSGQSFLSTLICLTFGLIAFLTFGVMATNIAGSGEMQKIREEQIVSIKDNTGTSGSFFLGFGTIDGSMKYSAYVDMGNGQYSLKSWDTETTIISETDIGKPRVETSRASGYVNWLYYTFRGEIKNVIYIPEGTIVREFNLDGE